MPVKKFKTFEEAEKDLWCLKPDEEYYRRINKLFLLAKELYKSDYPKGVHKYKTFEEAQEDLKRWCLENAKKKI
ncbi:MAG: hypothetical protein N2319_12985 [Candidatus Kapabacteria bacterium]|nr:hypothetical protein [Candidatus Kapabacteria bacterium]